MNTRFPVREQKKAQTRANLIRAARELFLAKGYDDTTLEEIAEAAGAHVQTLYRHFATKQALANAGDEYWLSEFRKAIQDPERTTDTFAFWRVWLEARLKPALAKRGKKFQRFLRMRAAAPQALAAMWAIQAQYEDLLTESLAKDFDMPADELGVPRLVAGMLLAGNGYVTRRYECADTDMKAEALDVIDQVEDMFGHLIVNKRRKTPKARSAAG